VQAACGVCTTREREEHVRCDVSWHDRRAFFLTSGVDRENLKGLVESMGFAYTDRFTKKTTHLICKVSPLPSPLVHVRYRDVFWRRFRMRAEISS
jgi:hypothetical protein